MTLSSNSTARCSQCIRSRVGNADRSARRRYSPRERLVRAASASRRSMSSSSRRTATTRPLECGPCFAVATVGVLPCSASTICKQCLPVPAAAPGSRSERARLLAIFRGVRRAAPGVAHVPARSINGVLLSHRWCFLSCRPLCLRLDASELPHLWLNFRTEKPYTVCIADVFGVCRGSVECQHSLGTAWWDVAVLRSVVGEGGPCATPALVRHC